MVLLMHKSCVVGVLKFVQHFIIPAKLCFSYLLYGELFLIGQKKIVSLTLRAFCSWGSKEF